MSPVAVKKLLFTVRVSGDIVLVTYSALNYLRERPFPVSFIAVAGSRVELKNSLSHFLKDVY